MHDLFEQILTGLGLDGLNYRHSNLIFFINDIISIVIGLVQRFILLFCLIVLFFLKALAITAAYV